MIILLNNKRESKVFQLEEVTKGIKLKSSKI
jgi:hypothetical protein